MDRGELPGRRNRLSQVARRQLAVDNLRLTVSVYSV